MNVGRRATLKTLAAPKSKTAAALGKRKTRTTARKRNEVADGASGSENSGGGGGIVDPTCQFVPVRRKPLGEYIKLDASLYQQPSLPLPVAHSSSSALSMSYAAAVENCIPLPSKYSVKVMITPRLKKSPKSSQVHSKSKTQNQKMKPRDTRFSIFDVEQPKPHIILVDPKQYRQDQTVKLTTKKGRKSKKSKILNPKKGVVTQLAAGATSLPSGKQNLKLKPLVATTATLPFGKQNQKFKPKDAPRESLTLKKKKPQTTTAASVPEIQQKNKDSPRIFLDANSYLSHHHQRLQLLLSRHCTASGCSVSSPQIGSNALQHSRSKPLPMELVHLDVNKFSRLKLEAAALLAQNRTMLYQWMNSEQLIS